MKSGCNCNLKGKKATWCPPADGRRWLGELGFVFFLIHKVRTNTVEENILSKKESIMHNNILEK